MFSLKFRNKLPGAVAAEFDQLLAGLRAFLSVSFDEDGTLLTQVATAIGTGDGVPAGVYVPYGGTTAPSGWLLCDGSAVSRSTYAALFAVIGTTYGAGDGATTFNLPDMRGRFPFGKATAGTGSTLGGTFGLIDHTHTGPSHTHTFTSDAPTGTTVVASGVGATVASSTHTHTGTTDAGGAGNTGTANAPGLTGNFIIRTGL